MWSRLPLVIAMLMVAAPAAAGTLPADTTWVTTFDEEFFNWATPHVQTFEFPPAPELYDEVLLDLTIGCPGPPGDCDPWDRIGHLRVIHTNPDQTEAQIEVARFITPYDITGPSSYPQTCTWRLDVTDYKPLLADSVTLRAYIESWIGGERGLLLTARFGFVHGVDPMRPYRVINLWTADFAEYGNPDSPIEDVLAPVSVEIPADAEMAKVRIVTTGHGQGNTDNCAEFCYKWHSLVAAGETFTHYLWRPDCAQNPCSPQGGTWQYPRAGWCPGDKVDPWDNDITRLITPGEPLLLDYNIQPYFNACGPHNPACVDGVTCTDCDYNYTGHTRPGFNVNAQLILYRRDLTAAPGAGEAQAPAGLRLGQNHPNPFNPTTTFYYRIAAPGAAVLTISSAGGRELLRIVRDHGAAGTYWYQWDGRDGRGRSLPSGVYFYQVESSGRRAARKMILLQ